MKKKLLLAFLILTLLIVSACSNNNNNNNAGNNENTGKENNGNAAVKEETIDPFGRYEETVTFTTVRATSSDPKFPEGESYEKNIYNTKLFEMLNIKPEYEWMVPSDGEAYKQKLELAIASADIPDIFSIGGDATYLKATLKRLVEADMIEDMTDIIEKYASPKIKEAYASNDNKTLEYYKLDGKLYAIPQQGTISDFPLMWVREDWRKQLNLPEPKTMDDIIALAKAFKEKDPAGGGKTVPFAMQMQNDPTGMFGGGAFFNHFSSFPRAFYKNADGKLVYGGIEPQTKEALGFMAQLYKEGLFEKDFALSDSGKAAEVLSSGRAGIVGHSWWGVWYPLNNTLQNVKGSDWKPYAIMGKNGTFDVSNGVPSTTIVVVKKGFKHPELAMKWLNLIAENKDTQWYIEPQKTLYKDAVERVPVWMGVTVDPIDRDFKKAGHLVDVIAGKMTKEELPFDEQDAVNDIVAFKDIENDPSQFVEKMGFWQNYRGWVDGMAALNQANPNITFKAFEGKTPTMEKKLTALENLQMNVYLKIIMGKESVDAFDGFVKDWKDQGGDEILKEIEKEIAQ